MIKNVWIRVIGALVVFIFANSASGVLFDFEDLALNDGPVEIGLYMTDVYGSSVTVTDGIVHNTGILGDDKYVHGCESGPHIISICFDVVAISSVSFDWAMELDEFNAYANDDEEPFFHRAYSWPGESGSSGTVVFDSPVNCLTFSDGGSWGQIEVDNIVVTSIPELTVMVLLGFGALSILRKRKR